MVNHESIAGKKGRERNQVKIPQKKQQPDLSPASASIL
jgi:hypothetical protein